MNRRQGVESAHQEDGRLMSQNNHLIGVWMPGSFEPPEMGGSEETNHAAAAAKSCQSCPTLCYPLDCSPPGSSVHGILQPRILKWVAIPFSRGSSQPRERTQVPCIAGGFFTTSATWEARSNSSLENSLEEGGAGSPFSRRKERWSPSSEGSDQGGGREFSGPENF